MDGSTFSALGAAITAVAADDDPKVAADFFKVLTISWTKVFKAKLFELIALASSWKNASILRGSPRSIFVRILSSTVFMLIIEAGDGGDCDLEVGLLADPPL